MRGLARLDGRPSCGGNTRHILGHDVAQMRASCSRDKRCEGNLTKGCGAVLEDTLEVIV